MILGYGSPTHSHMPLSETTPDSDLLSCLRRYILGPRAADEKSCLGFSSKVEESSQDMKDTSIRRGRMQMDVGYRMQDAGSKGKV
jgi:hypothetical protein